MAHEGSAVTASGTLMICYHHLRTSSSSSGQNSESHEDGGGRCGAKRLWSGSKAAWPEQPPWP